MTPELVPAGATPPAPPIRRPIGAPTLYRPEYCEMIVEYFQQRADAIQMYMPMSKEKAATVPLNVWQYVQMPTFPGFAVSVGTTQTSLSEWCRKHPAFALAYARAKEIHRKVYEDGLAMGRLNPTGAIFAAKNVLGWRDKIDIESSNTQIDAGNTVMAICLKAATQDELGQFRALLDAMKTRAIAAGLLNNDGTPMPTALIP